jgi:hypothetical protein
MCYSPLEPFLLVETSSLATGRDTVPVKHIVGHEAPCPQDSNTPPHKTLWLMSWLVKLLTYRFLVNLAHKENTLDFQYNA